MDNIDTRITRIVVKNYRGIEALDATVAPSGAVARGRNGGGKTTLLRAIKAALQAQDIGADAIRLGTDRAEILVDLDDLQVKRVITGKTSSVSVTRGEFTVKKPQTFLDALGAAIDPLDLLLLKKAERRARVLQAMPVKVTAEQLAGWGVSEPVDVSGHGLAVVEGLYRGYYEQRAVANKAAKQARSEADAVTKAAIDAAKAAPQDPQPVDVWEREVATSQDARRRLELRRDESERQRQRSEASLVKVGNLRDQAETVIANLIEPSPEKRRTFAERLTRAESVLDDLRRQVRDQEMVVGSLRETHREMSHAEELWAAAQEDRRRLLDAAAGLEAAIASTSVEPVTDAELEAAKASELEALRLLEAGRLAVSQWGNAQRLSANAGLAEAAARVAEDEANRLDVITRALARAPAELLDGAGGIPGLTLRGEDVLLDGVSLDALCGAEQVKLCVEIARRASRGKLLLVDGLERLDPEQFECFIKEATRDGWQLIATRVDRGSVVIEGIAADESREEAAE